MFLMIVDTLFASKGTSSSGSQTVQLLLLFIHYSTFVVFLNCSSNTTILFLASSS